MLVKILCTAEQMPAARRDVRRTLATAGFVVVTEYDRPRPWLHRLLFPGQQLHVIECRKPARPEAS
jgi:hypothetical protein